MVDTWLAKTILGLILLGGGWTADGLAPDGDWRGVAGRQTSKREDGPRFDPTHFADSSGDVLDVDDFAERLYRTLDPDQVRRDFDPSDDGASRPKWDLSFQGRKMTELLRRAMAKNFQRKMLRSTIFEFVKPVDLNTFFGEGNQNFAAARG